MVKSLSVAYKYIVYNRVLIQYVETLTLNFSNSVFDIKINISKLTLFLKLIYKQRFK